MTKLEQRVNLWEQLLGSVAQKSNKITPTKTLIVLGGQEAGIRQFIDSIRNCNSVVEDKRPKGKALPQGFGVPSGYTYVDIEDHEDGELLVRLRIYTICQSVDAFLVLLKDFLAAQVMRDIVVCVLLDWKQPQLWLREISFWIRHLKAILSALKDEHSHIAADLEHFTEQWSTRSRTFSDSRLTGSDVETSKRLAIVPPLADGEFDDSLGIPVHCIAQNADNMDLLERQFGIKDPQFDFIQQVVRTVLLKHGGSLTYTNLVQKNTISRPIRTILKEHLPDVYRALRQRSPDEPETMSRSQVFIPAGWDSWVKITVLRDGFDPSDIAKRWVIDTSKTESSDGSEGVVSLYEEVLAELLKPRSEYAALVEEFVQSEDLNTILSRLEQKQNEVQDTTEETADEGDRYAPQVTHTAQAPEPIMRDKDALNVDEMDAKLKSLKLRSAQPSSQPTTPTPGATGKSGTEKDEYVHAFFQNLLTRSNTAKAEAERQ